jgi:two-component system, sensor histidine kinase and response regulator
MGTTYKKRDNLKGDELLKSDNELAGNRFRLITDHIEDIVWQMNTEFEFEYVSPAVEKILGFAVEDMIGTKLTDYLTENTAARFREFVQYRKTSIGAPVTFPNDFFMKHKRGHLVEVEVLYSTILNEKNIPNGYAGITRDITERKKAEKLIRMLSAGMEQSPTSIIITDVKGDIEYVNQKFIQLTGYEANELIAKPLRILKPGKTPSCVYKEIWTNLQNGKEWRGENLNRKKNGEFYWESLLISPLRNNESIVVNYLIISEDITLRKQMEKELVEAKENAEEGNRLKTAFLNNLSHEIRTPLNAIVGFTGFLKDPQLPASKKHEYINIIQNSSDQLLSIITDIINVSILESGKAMPVKNLTDLSKVFCNLYDRHVTACESKKIELHKKLDIKRENHIVLTDESMLIQILNNLLNNAIKFSSNGKIEFACCIEDEFIRFYVKDSGIGIPKNLHRLIFERFRKVEIGKSRLYGGNGLGLSIAKSNVELLGGKIWVESEPDVGSTFHFTIPYCINPNN